MIYLVYYILSCLIYSFIFSLESIRLVLQFGGRSELKGSDLRFAASEDHPTFTEQFAYSNSLIDRSGHKFRIQEWLPGRFRLFILLNWPIYSHTFLQIYQSAKRFQSLEICEPLVKDSGVCCYSQGFPASTLGPRTMSTQSTSTVDSFEVTRVLAS